jgi:4-amino-4-deoxy-L-arabinose transferase-like glycosyltransferase
MANAEISQPQTSIYGQHPFWLKLCLVLMFLLAALIRLDEIQAPGHLLDREYTSAIFARAFYFMSNEQVVEWRREIAVTTMTQQPVLEPPLVEYLVSLIYRVMGHEEIYYSRYLTGAFWLVGGLFIYLITKKLLSTEAALFATLYYLFVPMGVIISRSFQPDSLMMMLFLGSLYLLVNYFENGAKKHLLQAAVVTAFTLLLRPLVLFAIFCALLALSLQKKGNWRKIIDWPLIIFSGVSLLPAAIYYGYGIVFAGFMRWKVSTSYMPHLLVKRDFWLGWFQLGINVVGTAFLIAAIIGFFLLRNRTARGLIIGLAISYVVFGVAFTYHIHTHPYYHIQLFPVVAICAASCLDSLVKALRNSSGKLWPVPIILSVAISLYFAYRTERDTLYQTRMEDPRTAWRIGEIIGHNPHTVFVSRYYGIPLEYYGEFGGAPWPVGIEDPFYREPGAHQQSVQERIDGLGFEPEYFVITSFDLYQRLHQDLAAYLESTCSVRLDTTDYLIYTQCHTISKH